MVPKKKFEWHAIEHLKNCQRNLTDNWKCRLDNWKNDRDR